MTAFERLKAEVDVMKTIIEKMTQDIDTLNHGLFTTGKLAQDNTNALSNLADAHALLTDLQEIKYREHEAQIKNLEKEFARLKRPLWKKFRDWKNNKGQ